MKRLFSFVISFFLCQVVSAQDSISVLFIGNSYVYSNDLPGMLSQLTSNLGKKITVDSKVNGGYTFSNHANDPQTYTKLHAKPWDVVVLQGQSQEPSFPDGQVNSQTFPPAMRLADSVYANNPCGNVMYFMTWGRKNGDSQWSGINTFEKMNSRLYSAYMRLADSSNHAMVSPVGSVWAYVRANHPSIELYVPDESHPSVAGTYLAACTFYTSLFQSSSVGATYYGGLDAATAEILQQASTHVLDSLQKFHLHPVSKPTQALFSYTNNGLDVVFHNESIRANTYQWSFGDGMTSSSEHPQHTYNAAGAYDVELIAESVCNSDTFYLGIPPGVLGLKGDLFAGVQMRKSEDVLFLSSKETGYVVSVVTLEGRMIQSATLLTEDEVGIVRLSSLQLIVVEDERGGKRVIRW